MPDIYILIGILGALLVGAMSPGPSFVLVSRMALSGARRGGLSAAVGMGLGGAFFASLAPLGLITLLLQVPWLYLTLKFAGGLYLIFLGVQIWRGSSQPLAKAATQIESGRGVSGHATAIAFSTQVANPKTAVVYASIFASFLPPDASWALVFAIPPAVFLVETAWYSVVALLLSTPAPQNAYLRWKATLDRVAGAVLGGLGAHLIISNFRENSA